MGWDFKFPSRQDGSIKQVVFTDAFFTEMGKGKIINAIRELKSAQGCYVTQEGPLSIMRLREAKDITYQIMNLLWPSTVITCPQCYGKGTVEEKHKDHPYHRS